MEKFEDAASRDGARGFLSDLWYFARHRKKWWLLPPLVVLLIVGLLVLLGGTGAAPFIYTLF